MIIYDTTLRDGTQNKDVNLTVRDKVEFAKILDDFKADYIELGWPGSNPKDMEAFLEASKLKFNHAKIAAFCSTRKKELKANEDPNLRAVLDSKAAAAAVFGKTWILHIERQLKASKDENLDAISDSIKFLKKSNLEVFFDAEHFFDGFKDDKEYALECLKKAVDAGASCIVLCDTNGGCLPDEILGIVNEVRAAFPDAQLGIHCHNDSGCAVANTLIVAGKVNHIQGTINGVGERCGNADLCQILPNIVLKKNIQINADLSKLKEVSDKFNILANIKPQPNQPFVGKNAFSHKGGVHVDALSKGASYEHIDPEAVGNSRDIVLSDLSGSANIVEAVKQFGVNADKKDPRIKEMLDEVKLLEKKGYDIGDLEAEKYLLANKHFLKKDPLFTINGWKIISENIDGELYSECIMDGNVNGSKIDVIAPVKEQGPVDAAYDAFKKLLASFRQLDDIKLINYKVMIAEDKGAESSVRVYIEFSNNGNEWATIGVNENILSASLEAIEKGFRYYLLRFC
ncbi:MAG: citramalate synthase [Candidatus Woesearchaeota archaeon]|nr:citramalate synthase [Candidatus Woesearchaeota archaeon]